MALAYLRIKESEPMQMMADLFDALRETEKNRSNELRAVVRIQRFVRGWMARRYIRILNKRATEMQRLWRGHRDRKRVSAIKAKHFQQQNAEYYNYLATKIQKVWRGYTSRKTKHDFYKRREYIRTIHEKSIKMMAALDEKERENYAKLQAEQERAMAIKFSNLTSNMHHLLSTKTQPGVFNASGFQTTAFGVPIEQHIKHNYSQSRQYQVSNIQQSIRKKYAKQRIKGKTKPNFYPFGSRSRRFEFGENPDPMGPDSSATSRQTSRIVSRLNSVPGSPKDDGSSQFTYASQPSPVHIREVRRKKLRDKAARIRGH